jgi:hypothetical protein
MTSVYYIDFTLGLPPPGQHRVDVCESCRRDCSGYGPGHVRDVVVMGINQVPNPIPIFEPDPKP